MKKGFLLVLIIYSVTTLYSESLYIEKINIKGLKRTKESTVLSIIGINVGMEISNNTLVDIEQRLLRAEIFQNSIDVSYSKTDNKSVELNIYVEDKWTIIPIPVYYTGSEGWTAGGVFIESNLLGLNQQLVSGAFMQDSGKTAFLAWKTPIGNSSRYTAGISLSYVEEEEIREDITTSLTLERIYTNNFNLGMASGFSSRSNKTYYVGNLSLDWDNLFYSRYFNRGWDIKTDFDIDIPLEDTVYHPHLGVEVRENRLLGSKLFKWGINSSITTNNLSPLLFGGTETYRTIPKDTEADFYTAGLLHFEPVIWDLSWGHISTPVYYEGGVYNRLGDLDMWHGPGFGFRLYVSKVVIPAVGADITWDLNSGEYSFTLAIGSRE